MKQLLPKEAKWRYRIDLCPMNALSEEFTILKATPFELKQFGREFLNIQDSIGQNNRSVLDKWIVETNDKGHIWGKGSWFWNLMLGIWGKECVNPELMPSGKNSNFEGSLDLFESEILIITIDPDFVGTPTFWCKFNQPVNIKLEQPVKSWLNNNGLWEYGCLNLGK